jgi:exosortase
LATGAAIIFWIGAFAFLYGFKAFSEAIFPLGFLFFMVPIPAQIMDKVIYALQIGSAEFTSLFFALMGIPISREGFVFHTPTVSIEIAKQCSGIRSSLGLIITAVLASHFFLKSNWHKAILIAAIYPITVFKNAVRIVTLTLLAIHVDEGFLTGGFLHKSGGFIFYLPALGMMGVILMVLRRRKKD